MSYDISFKVKIDGIDKYIDTGYCSANITWNVRKIIELSTGLPWKNESNNGLCIDVIPCIERGLKELNMYPERYQQYESPNGWGTVRGTKRFYEQILGDWAAFCSEYGEEVAKVATFWIE